MKGYLLINDEQVGYVELKIIDESMGVIGGNVIPLPAYARYKAQIQDLFETKGIANIHDFDFSFEINGEKVKAEGRIGLIDSAEFNEIEVAVAGVNEEIVNLI